MQVWTTKQLSALLLNEGLPYKLLHENEIKDVFLKDALPCDIAIIPFCDDYMDFLSPLRAKGITGPVIFISQEPTIIPDNLLSYNSILLEMKNMRVAVIRNIVNFIIRLAEKQIRKWAGKN